MNSPPLIRRDAAVTVTLVVVCQGFNMLTVGGIALFLPLIREDLDMSFAQAGMLSAAATFTYALGQIPAGYLADRFGPKRLFFLGILGSTLLSLNFGMLQSYPAAIANQIVSGVFRALIFAHVNPGGSLTELATHLGVEEVRLHLRLEDRRRELHRSGLPVLYRHHVQGGHLPLHTSPSDRLVRRPSGPGPARA